MGTIRQTIERIKIERISDPNDFVEMYVNPQRISIRQSKVMQQVQTNTGWIFQHWGYEPIVISYSGVTGYIDHSENPYTTNAYRALLKLKHFYEAPQKQLQGMAADLNKISAEVNTELSKLALRLHYRADTYDGYLTRFEFTEEESSPWLWSYSMEFKAYSSTYSPLSESSSLKDYEGEARNRGLSQDSDLTGAVNLQ